MRERSPIEYVDRVTAPLLLLAGEHDSRCPLQQILNYVERLKARGHPHELYLYGTGHSSFNSTSGSASSGRARLPVHDGPGRQASPGCARARRGEPQLRLPPRIMG